MCLLPSLKWSSTISSLGIVQWDFTRRDHPGNPGRVSGLGLVTSPVVDQHPVVITDNELIEDVDPITSNVDLGALDVVIQRGRIGP